MKFRLSGDRSGELSFRYSFDEMWSDIECRVTIGASIFSGEIATTKTLNKPIRRQYRIFALTKALKSLARETRAEIWQAYWSTHKTTRQSSIDRFVFKYNRANGINPLI